MNKEIKELSEVLVQCGYEHEADIIANRVFNLGYRKQSDTIKEFAEKYTAILKEIIQNRLDYHCDKTKYRYELGKACVEFFISDIIKDLINELKKEYGVE